MVAYAPEHTAADYQRLALLLFDNNFPGQVEKEFEADVICTHIGIRVNAGAGRAENTSLREEAALSVVVDDFAIGLLLAQALALKPAERLVIVPAQLVKVCELVRAEVHAERFDSVSLRKHNQGTRI